MMRRFVSLPRAQSKTARASFHWDKPPQCHILLGVPLSHLLSQLGQPPGQWDRLCHWDSAGQAGHLGQMGQMARFIALSRPRSILPLANAKPTAETWMPRAWA